MRLTGKYFKDHLKKRVSIIGKVIQEDGSVCKLESACGMTVTVMCPNKPDRLLNQLVEIIGTVQSADAILAEEHVVFPPEFCLDYGQRGLTGTCGPLRHSNQNLRSMYERQWRKDPSVHAEAIAAEQLYGGKHWREVAFSEAELSARQ
ncbi:uncharacterized protein LOC111263989 isoform X1 [Varroa jacobsoni]|uniref:uncharacterized protein LOC111263989 isoform X1 n=1 Tax=Varroa jacobsoni TaxID=62625 RepID=UPI000BF5D986|nr:uncharacterized protein LOC111263989 isoform X1 [Varroa jacobsoni]